MRNTSLPTGSRELNGETNKGLYVTPNDLYPIPPSARLNRSAAVRITNCRAEPITYHYLTRRPSNDVRINSTTVVQAQLALWDTTCVKSGYTRGRAFPPSGGTTVRGTGHLKCGVSCGFVFGNRRVFLYVVTFRNGMILILYSSVRRMVRLL